MKLLNLFQNSNRNNMDNSEKYWKDLKDKDYNHTFPQVESWLMQQPDSLDSETQIFKLNKNYSMKNFFVFNKFKLVYTFLLFTVAFAACNMPVTQSETVARGLNWKIAKSSAEGVEKINMLQWIDKSKLTVQELNETDKSILTYNLILTTKSEDELRNYMKQLESIPGVITVNLYALNETTERPLYAAALHTMFRIDVDATNMSDEQATLELQKQLKDAGIDNVNISYKRNSSGDRMLEMSPIENSSKDNNFELRIKDGENQQFLKTRTNKDEIINFEGKSDEEIKKIVVEDMKKDGIDIKPEELILERNADGKVKIKIEKTEGKNRMQKQDK